MRLLKHKAYINGEWIDSNSGKTFEVTNPYNNEVIGSVSDCGQEETKLAIDAASEAFKTWKKYAASERADLLKKWYQLQIDNAEELGKILTLEQGKPLQEAIGEIKYGASFVEWFAEEARRNYGDVIPGHQRDKRILTIKQPIGVVAAITPWNFPNAMITRKVAPALAAGCTVVIKPANLTPFSALALAALAEEAGIPPGVINIIQGTNASAIGLELCKNPIVKKLSFTGSTPVGKILLKQCADTVKKVSMELGGNAPFIVFDDADIDAAVEGAIISKYRNAGQTCVCTNRIFVQESVYDLFIEKFTKAVKLQKIGNGLEDGVTIGPLVEEKAIQFVESVVKDATNKGAKVVLGGKRFNNSDNSLVYEPTILANVTKDMDVYKEEIFGPVAPVFKFKTEEEVIAYANDTPFGLASYFYGRDYAKIWRVAEALEYGMVGINTGLISTTVAPFGGIKESGFGREGSKYGMDDYLEIKYLCFGGIE
ncbi:NAD-dependent succinate-semialdehyde dehydrogenase [Polaribacter sp. L3A8]|uniref:NAD-dependent succinate-semialdehyde dehydrogenase n=1 Tax=Polaribacter sp. L3A8 TaxID=2686361 RepID=UPI00131D95F9|nr:NAD-dependent succinate-semialdehyde dehydrogenase [Polaribacter sp. L3A8]